MFAGGGGGGGVSPCGTERTAGVCSEDSAGGSCRAVWRFCAAGAAGFGGAEAWTGFVWAGGFDATGGNEADCCAGGEAAATAAGGGATPGPVGCPASSCSPLYLALLRSAIRPCWSLSRSMPLRVLLGSPGTLARLG